MERWGRRSKQLPYDLRENGRYWKLKEEALNHSLWRTRCGGHWPVIWQNTDEDDDDDEQGWGIYTFPLNQIEESIKKDD